jgi:hypothetical protein
LFPYPANTYYDKGATSNSVGGFPTTTHSRFRAYVQTTAANFTPATTAKWQLGTMNIVIPSDYDTSKSTDRQWLILGMNTGFGGSARELLVDQISLDDKYGIFTKCPLDFNAKRNVSTAATAGDQGTSGGGSGPVDPGEGGGCPTFDQLIETDHGPIAVVDLIDHEDKYKIINRNNRAVEYSIEIQQPQVVYTLNAGPYTIIASGTHPVFTDPVDLFGVPLCTLRRGDKVLTKVGTLEVDFIVKHFKKRHTVKISLKGQEKGFFQNGIAVHNEKPIG